MSLVISRRAVARLAVALGFAWPAWRSALAGTSAQRPLEEFLTVALQRLFPHEAVPAELYADIARGMAANIAADESLAGLFATGRGRLDDAADGNWLELDADAQAESLAGLEQTPFFQTLRGVGGVSFYNDPRVWPYFGYEGSSFEQGGYLKHGFDDIDWLPKSGV